MYGADTCQNTCLGGMPIKLFAQNLEHRVASGAPAYMKESLPSTNLRLPKKTLEACFLFKFRVRRKSRLFGHCLRTCLMPTI